MSNSNRFPTGTNVRILLQKCQCPSSYLLNPEIIIPLLKNAIQTSGLTDLAYTSHTFPGAGFTAAYILAESHVVIHTWPEYSQLAVIEISVCDFQRSNRSRALTLSDEIRKLFLPEIYLIEHTRLSPRFADKNFPGHGSYLELEEIVATRRSAIQDISIVETEAFGRALILDDELQTTEKDEFFYHEPLVHIPLLQHPHPLKVLICGGGDGGAAEEALKHPSVQECWIVDIDAEVVNLCRQELQGLHHNVFDNPKVHTAIADASEFIKKSAASFDVILMDSTDPKDCSKSLFTEEFYRNVFSCLSPGGLIGLHVGSPLILEEFSARAVKNVRSVFPSVYPYTYFVPSYGKLMGYLLATKNTSQLIPKEEVVRRLQQRNIHNLKIISCHTFPALFAIPPLLEPIFR